MSGTEKHGPSARSTAIGAAILLGLTACGGARTTTTPTPAAVKLPGACVDPAADAAERLASEISGSGFEDPPYEQPGPDVDGDGTPDRLFSIGAGYTTNTLVYVMRGSCGHFVGDIGMPPEPASSSPTRHQGLIDLRVPEVSSCEGARCGCEPGWGSYRFDGEAYTLDEASSKQSSENPCPDEE